MIVGFDASRAFVNEATGTENYSLNLLKSLAKIDRENKYRVYVRPVQSGQWSVHSQNAKTDLALITKHLSLPKNFELKILSWPRLWTQAGLALETWKNPVDVLFVPAHTLPILRRRKIGILNSQFSIFNSPRTKYVVTIHDLGVEYLPGYHQFPQRYYLDLASKYAAKNADALIAVSQATKNDLISRYRVDGKKVFVVHEGVDRAFFKPQSKSKVESVKKKYGISGDYILFVGTIQPRKNLQMLIQAFGKVVGTSGNQVTRKPDNPDTGVPDNLQLVIAGKLGWDYQEILAAPKKFGVEDRVKFIGRVADADLPALYSGASVFAFPSLFEGFGLPILEAFSSGCPVIASDIGPHREIMRKLKIAEAGTLVKVDDVDGWARILYQNISNHDKRVTIVRKANAGLGLFSWDKAAKQTKEVFSRLKRV